MQNKWNFVAFFAEFLLNIFHPNILPFKWLEGIKTKSLVCYSSKSFLLNFCDKTDQLCLALNLLSLAVGLGNTLLNVYLVRHKGNDQSAGFYSLFLPIYYFSSWGGVGKVHRGAGLGLGGEKGGRSVTS